MSLFFFMASVLLSGGAVIACVRRETISMWRGWAIVYGIGTAVVAFELFLYFVIFRFSFSPSLYWFFGIQSMVAAWVIAYRIPWGRHMSLRYRRVGIFAWVLGIIIALLLVFSLVQALGNPPAAFDSIAFWATRAQILLTDGQVDFNPQSPTYLSAYSHSNYPWHLSFQEYWFRQLGARGGLVNLIAWSYFLSLVLLLGDFLIKRLGAWKGLLLTFFCCSQPLLLYHASNNYADLIIGYYVAVGFAFFLDWLEKGRLPLLMVSAAFFSWTICIKNYGIFYIIAFLIGLMAVKLWKVQQLSGKEWLYTAAAFLIPLLPLGIFKTAYRLNLRNSDPAWVWHPEALASLGKMLFVSGNWNIWWVVFIGFAGFLLPTIYRQAKIRIGWLMFGAVLCIIVSVFLVTENYQWALDQTALSRAFIPLVPISILLVGFSVAVKETLSKHKIV